MSKVTFIEKDVLRSKAFKQLPGTAIQVLMWFYLKRRLKNIGRRGKEKWIITNNGEIIFSYAEAEKKYELTRSRFSRALDELIDKGFIDIAHHGGGMMGDCTLYSISDRCRDYGTEQFIHAFRPKDTRGLGFTNKNWEDRTGKKKRPRLKVSNDNDTSPSNKSVTGKPTEGKCPSIKNVTEQTMNIPLILKAMHYYLDIRDRNIKNVTVL